MLNIQGSYIVFGPEVKPEVHILDARAYTLFVEGAHLCHRRCPKQWPTLLSQTFRAGVDEILCAWDEALLRMLAEKYEGPWEREIRALCAAIVLRMPFQELHDRRSEKGNDGGSRVQQPRRPRTPQPGGIAVAIPKSG